MKSRSKKSVSNSLYIEFAKFWAIHLLWKRENIFTFGVPVIKQGILYFDLYEANLCFSHQNTVNTRCVSVPLRDGQHEVCLVPLFDMLNHSADAQTELKFEQHTQLFRVITHHSISRGEEAFLNYGKHDNVYPTD
jgi:hypothetical protein